ncbi:HNH endonuclease signature motif containing protein [Streptomyces stelliscabiei]|uniref:HNH endonuclease n=1 Tax=Streptomyces stelliscabiei TaxID=146820 RepID=UPI002FF29B86
MVRGRGGRNLKLWTDHQRWLIAAETGFACAYCQVIFGSVARRPGHESVVVRMQVDHVIPFAFTGHEGERENVVAACQICNSLKQDTIFDSIVNARRHLDRLWVKAGYVIEFIPTRSHFEDPDGWAKEYARHMRTIGVRQDAE